MKSERLGLLVLVPLCLLSLPATAQVPATAEASHADTQHAVVHLSHFTDDLHRAFMALKMAKLMQEGGVQTTLFLDIEGAPRRGQAAVAGNAVGTLSNDTCRALRCVHRGGWKSDYLPALHHGGRDQQPIGTPGGRNRHRGRAGPHFCRGRKDHGLLGSIKGGRSRKGLPGNRSELIPSIQNAENAIPATSPESLALSGVDHFALKGAVSRIHHVLVPATVILTVGLLWAAGRARIPGNDKVRLGVYDNRAIAMAWVRSKYSPLPTKMKELQQAKAERDEKKTQQLNEWGEMLQPLHFQGFGKYPVDEYLDQVQEKLPEVMAQHQLDAIVWMCHSHQDHVTIVDVTPDLMRLFGADDQVIQQAAEMKEHCTPSTLPHSSKWIPRE